MSLRVDRSTVDTATSLELDEGVGRAQVRRDRNRAARVCLNENDRGEHGPATHGVLCLACREHHRGHMLESTYGRERYREMLSEARRIGVSIVEYANRLVPVSAKIAGRVTEAASRGGLT